ncbi:hypothetical protein NNJEOMEG_03048 [Fundidesulfovibrio magnetotacticus]|uniref:Uncharacterized protein n=1 Tax=Fundidesulfovibrio magnetotacticus TaxID=2730080 RepID=A0A6V8LWB6_9BACT|nr:hypothetical protein [Fundidesulfovibrio magnetotacticus]GFK95190.1 hypothetical protein NNJEOMEG_03048 [Fundidesulfovibrio magnetotacticus]
MSDDWGSTGIPEDNTKLPLVPKVRSLLAQDKALAAGEDMQGFSSRQTFFGFRQPSTNLRTPEVDLGALFDLGS